MPTFDVWIKLACYVACIGVALEFSHKLYWSLYRTINSSEVSSTVKAAFSMMFASLPLIAVYVITTAFCTYVDNASVASLGLKLHPNYMADIMSGAAIAFACISVMFFTGCTLGWFHIRSSSMGTSGDSVSSFCGGVTDFFVGSVFEELAVRGYIFFVLQQAFGGQNAVIGSALIFAFLHFVKHHRVPFLFTVNAVLFGLLAGQCRLITGMLWVPIGLHFGWNLAMGPIFGLPYNGRSYDDGLVACTVEGPHWVTGGDYSPDAGLIGTLTLAIAALILMAVVPVC